MKIVVAADHGGVDLKKEIMSYLESRGHTVANLGVDDTSSVDYPDIAQRACSHFLAGHFDFGILVCGTGIGISIAANKIKGIRCALVHDLYTAEMAKSHNHANFIAFGGRVTYGTPVSLMIDKFIETKEIEGRHQNRIHKISELEGR